MILIVSSFFFAVVAGFVGGFFYAVGAHNTMFSFHIQRDLETGVAVGVIFWIMMMCEVGWWLVGY